MSTTQVIEWLEIFKKDWIRINKEDLIDLEYIGEDIQFKLKHIKFKFSDIDFFWYRRGFFNVNLKYSEIIEYRAYQREEYNSLLQYLYYKLQKIPHLDSIKNLSVNKLIISNVARELHLTTPKDYFFSNRKPLDLFFKENEGSFISKSVSGIPTINFEKFSISNYTTKINIDDIEAETFFPSLVQNYIDKKFELRIFYLKGTCYSMAIFSQNDQQTKIDFRHYNDSNPNRRVPYKLPVEIEIKIDKLMKALDFDSGSIDMIVSSDNEYVFLEVNPTGQFGMTSFPCNYNIEKKIAEYLSYGTRRD